MDRDIRDSDEFTYVFERSVTENGRTIESGDLLYASLKGAVFYRFQRPGSSTAEYFDATGKNMRSAMMRTPLDGYRRISSSFGFRVHPISGYRKMFDKAYPGEGISTGTIAKAIASFERTVLSTESAFDRWFVRTVNAIERRAPPAERGHF